MKVPSFICKRKEFYIMTLADVLALAKAGYTAEQISALSAAEQPDPKPADPKPDPKPADPKPDQNGDIIAELRELKTAILNSAVLGAQMPKPQDAEAALAAIINPPDVLEMLNKGNK